MGTYQLQTGTMGRAKILFPLGDAQTAGDRCVCVCVCVCVSSSSPFRQSHTCLVCKPYMYALCTF